MYAHLTKAAQKAESESDVSMGSNLLKTKTATIENRHGFQVLCNQVAYLMITVKKNPGRKTDLKNCTKYSSKCSRRDNPQSRDSCANSSDQIGWKPSGFIHKVTQNKVGNTLVTSNAISVKAGDIW